MRIEESQGTNGGPNGHAQPAKSGPTAEQILGEIRDYCRQTQTAEITFGRLLVNDGKLVSRLRDGAGSRPAPSTRSAPISPSTRPLRPRRRASRHRLPNR